jgi:hypothetical protein
VDLRRGAPASIRERRDDAQSNPRGPPARIHQPETASQTPRANRVYKTPPKQRAQVRASKQRNPPDYKTEKSRAYFRAYARKNKHKRNEQRRARRNRHLARKKIGKRELAERFAGLSVVTAANLVKDYTIWRGPNQRIERRTDDVATRWLARKQKKKTP